MTIRAAAALVAAALVVAAVLGCGSPPPGSPSPSDGAPTAPTSPTASASSSVAASTPVTDPPPASGAIAVDPSLLDVLPAEVDGITMRPDPETAAEIATATELAADLLGIAVALYIGSEATGSDDFAIVNVVETRPAVGTDAWYRSWRETYDAAACEPAGGLAVGGATAEIDGRVVDIGTCENGGHTYHVRLEDPARIISITALGEARLGERILGELKE